MTLREAKNIIDAAMRMSGPKEMEDYMRFHFKKSAAAGLAYFVDAIDDYPELIKNMKEHQIAHLTKFMSKDAVKRTPLYDRLTIEQKADLEQRKDVVRGGLLSEVLSDFAKNIGFQDGIEELEERFEDLKAIHPEWTDKDTLAYMKNRAARYTTEWEWIEEREEELKRHGKITIAAPAKKIKQDEVGKPVMDTKKNKKEVLKEFSKPEMSEARFSISETNALGGDWYDLKMTLPVSVEFLKAKEMDFKMGDFASFNSNDPIEILTMMANEELEKRTGQNFYRPRISTVDLQRQRAKNGMKTVEMTWEVRSPMQAYALGVDLTQWRGYAEVVKTPAEYNKRMAAAEKVADDALQLRKDIKSGAKPDTAWKEYMDEIAKQGLNYKIAKMHKLESSLFKYPNLRDLLS